MAADYNFNYPLDLSKLQNVRIKLVPFDSNLPKYAYLYASKTASSEAGVANFTYLPYGPFASATDFLEWYVPAIQRQANVVWFAIMVRDGWRKAHDDDDADDADDADPEGDFAGSIAYLNADPANASCENGHLNIIPRYQRTFVNTHANGLLLHYMLDPPSQGGLGIRRMQWFANAANERSQLAAKRLGFRLEGILRWHRVLPGHKEGVAGGEKDVDGNGPGDGRGSARHSALLSLCWDDWREGGRERVAELMAR
ncbi:uncharacterized protein HMPREF1541_01835 [Cyphellophora europaea CBS 101466]|uniref:N-acetyltransferase domain-containing protein n=1 Tax=Cyphellophora europaea (strain CBS 101466) TaxID=1220924 RepID=W2S3Q7_CYPE1|nr:uncharacterized protein HMPREF1541_01835 [Cyphellophora europaea CBS 101466]ETN42678.1 hypothetical protein HMPREF1541_01835 [Cyphellophora europaea CBS 101466]